MFIKLIPLFGKLVQTITLNKLIIWALTAAVLIVGYTFIEKRAYISQIFFKDNNAQLFSPSSFTLSELTKSNIRTLVSSENEINGVIVLSANIRNNLRVPIFWHSDSENIQRNLDELYKGKNSRIPLFSSDQKNNEEIVSVINGEFTCTAFDDAVNAAIFPKFKESFPFICRTSLPPYYGQFSGYIAFALRDLPDSTALDRIKSESITIATEIYFRDILSTTK